MRRKRRWRNWSESDTAIWYLKNLVFFLYLYTSTRNAAPAVENVKFCENIIVFGRHTRRLTHGEANGRTIRIEIIAKRAKFTFELNNFIFQVNSNQIQEATERSPTMTKISVLFSILLSTSSISFRYSPIFHFYGRVSVVYACVCVQHSMVFVRDAHWETHLERDYK